MKISKFTVVQGFHNTVRPRALSGSVKRNTGHLEGGSGIAGPIKTVMVLEKAQIPPNANYEHVNPDINVEFLNLKGFTPV